MKALHTKRPSTALVISIAALFVALGGTGFAAFALPKNSVGTKQLKNNAVTTSKLKNAAVTGSKIDLRTIGTVHNADTANSAVFANEANHASNATTANALGGLPPSAFEHASSILTAVVTNNGSAAAVVRGSPGVTATRGPDPHGEVYVHMGQDVSSCTWIATQGNPGSSFVPGVFATVRGNTTRPGGGSVNDVDVVTYDTTGAEVDANFHLLVIC